MVDGKPLLRAYSIASAHYEEHLEFFSIKVQDGPLTSRLQHLQVGDDVLVGRKPTGTLVLTDLLPGRYLYLFATGTGLAPFMSIIRDPDTYERFEKIVLVHGVRKVDELAYADLIAHELPQHDHLGEQVRDQLVYYPTVTREPFRNQGRLPDLIANGKLCSDIGFPQIDPKQRPGDDLRRPGDAEGHARRPRRRRLHDLGRHRPGRRLRDRARVRREVSGSTLLELREDRLHRRVVLLVVGARPRNAPRARPDPRSARHRTAARLGAAADLMTAQQLVPLVPIPKHCGSTTRLRRCR